MASASPARLGRPKPPPSASLLPLLCLVLASSLLLLASAKPCPAVRKKVIIIGAGMSGVTAAKEILKAKPCTQVKVLEARERVGGRMYSRTGKVPGLGTVRAEMGGQWIEGGEPNPLYKVAQSMGLVVRYEGDKFLWFDANGKRYTAARLARAQDAYEYLKERAIKFAYNSDKDISIDAAFRAVNRKLYLTPYVQNNVANDFDFTEAGSNDLSGYYWEDESWADGDALVINGYDNIPKNFMKEAQRAGAQLMLKFEVTHITQAAKGKKRWVTVTGRPAAGGGKPQSFTADAVLVTVPLGVLKAGVITFKPELSSAKRAAMNRMAMGHGTKVALFYKNKFWDVSADDIFIEDKGLPLCRGRFPFWRSLAHPEGQNALMGYAVGEYALKQSGRTRVLIRDARKKVAAMFPKARTPGNAPLAVWVKDWTADKYSRGMYSYPKVGSKGNGQHTTDYDTMGLPEGRIYFAGEHTNQAYRASVHGAYFTGLREAKRIAALL